ncbi:hypothetical protein SADUNF_Sadunf11G0046600 [Salix dunnii]|uniref:Uncharacterized protein n=1 Tax=Salix dunnii TaxID=1413687 RepID=A0A835JK86_9ROSI|nr:hypothetical protein SADUNF_Sadunf11G0046600 [Salix dunnii]
MTAPSIRFLHSHSSILLTGHCGEREETSTADANGRDENSENEVTDGRNGGRNINRERGETSNAGGSNENTENEVINADAITQTSNVDAEKEDVVEGDLESVASGVEYEVSGKIVSYDPFNPPNLDLKIGVILIILLESVEVYWKVKRRCLDTMVLKNSMFDDEPGSGGHVKHTQVARYRCVICRAASRRRSGGSRAPQLLLPWWLTAKKHCFAPRFVHKHNANILRVGS